MITFNFIQDKLGDNNKDLFHILIYTYLSNASLHHLYISNVTCNSV